jgi:hypothetical protein
MRIFEVTLLYHIGFRKSSINLVDVKKPDGLGSGLFIITLFSNYVASYTINSYK